MAYMTLKDRPFDERPYEKYETYGAGSLTDTELLAIILRSGTRGKTAVELAGEILAACPFEEGLAGLYHVSLQQLMAVPGVGRVKAVQLKCIAELSRRISRRRKGGRPVFSDPASIAAYYMETLRHEEVEYIYCLMLDARNQLAGEECLSKGTATQALLSPRELFMRVLRYNAPAIVLVHNHPSGDPSPSPEDISLTLQVKESGLLLGITLFDHIIIGNNTFVSFMQEGYI